MLFETPLLIIIKILMGWYMNILSTFLKSSQQWSFLSNQWIEYTVYLWRDPGETGTLAHISMIENLTEIWIVLVIFPLNSVIPNLMNWAQIIQRSLKIIMTIFKKHALWTRQYNKWFMCAGTFYSITTFEVSIFAAKIQMKDLKSIVVY